MPLTRNDRLTTAGKAWGWLLLLLVATVAVPAHAGAGYQYPNVCTDCHGMPPLDAAYRNITTGGFKGSHATHNPAVAAPTACVKCHAGSDTYATDHMNDFVNMTSNLNHSVHPGRATYNKARFFNQTSNPVLQNCANVNCHFERSTPLWSSSQYTSPASCGDCHGAPPAGTSSDSYSGGAAGSHAKHDSYYTGAAKCSTCHPDRLSAAVFSHATSAGHAGVAVSVTITPGTYSGDGTNYLPSQAGGKTFGTCSGTYCHGTATPDWGGPSLSCTACHSANNNGRWATDSAHKLHWGSSTLVPGKYENYSGNVSSAGQYRFTCSSCHAPSGGATHAQGPKNAGSAADVAFPAAYGGSYSYGATPGATDNGFKWTTDGTGCNGIYCHSDGQGHNGAAVAWGTTSTTGSCTICHGSSTANGPAGFALSGKHPSHTNNPTVLGTGNSIACAVCHAQTVSSGTAISDKSYHVNLIKNYSGAVGANKGIGTHTLATKICTNNYCHSSGQATPVYRTLDAWDSGTTYDCKACHGADSAFASLAGEPNYANTVGTPNSHRKHVTGAGVTPALRCAICHYRTTDAAAAAKLRDYSTLHLNGSPDVALKLVGGKTGTYDPGNKTCAATFCHGNSTSPSWGATTVCNDCHSASAAPSGSGINSWGTQSAHKIHWEDNVLPTTYDTPPGNSPGDANTYRFACSSCHFQDAVNHGSGPYNAVSAASVYFGYTTAGVVGTYTPGGTATNNDNGFNWTAGTGCSGSYCHSNGEGQPSAISFSWSQTSRTAYNCNLCHGNSRAPNNDWRRSAPLYVAESNTYRGAPKGNAHDKHISAQAALTGTHIQCFNCHGATTRDNTSIYDKQKHMSKTYNIFSYAQGLYSSAFRDGDYPLDAISVTENYNYSPTGSRCSNVSCHPIGLNLTSGLSYSRFSSSVPWNRRYQCVNCHNMNMEGNDTFHHAMRNYSSTYPTTSPNGDAASGTNTLSRRCTMCHVDHDIFSPDINTSSGGRAYNLRTDIGTTPNTGSGFTNTDFAMSGNGGICISCHYQAKTKDTTRRRNDAGTTVTPAVTLANFSGSAHQYNVPAKYFSDGSSSNGNCAKCHNALQGETSVFMNITTAAGSLGLSFGNHNSGIRRLMGSLGGASSETSEEQICYRCHSHTTDADPGGGIPKAIDGRDYYGVAVMGAAAEEIFTANNYYRPANPTYSSTNRLFFKPSTGDAGYPAAPMPDTPANDTDLGDTFAGGSYIIRSMSPWATATNYETKNQNTNLTGTRYWKMAKFVSPAVYADTTVPAGSWNISLYCRENSSTQNSRVRYTVYKWTAGDAKGAAIIAKGTVSTELSTTVAPGSIRTVSIYVPATTLTAGEKIVVDLALQTTTTSSTSTYTSSFYFGNRAPSSLTLPGNVSFSYADPGTPQVYGHAPFLYSGIHKPSPTDETRAFIAANKHIECGDCHNPHATRKGLHNEVTVSDTTLYFKAPAQETATSPKPAAFITASGTYGGTTTYATLNGAMSMSPGVGTTADNTAQTDSTTAANRYYRFGQFVSLPFAKGTTFTTADSFTLHVRGRQSATAENPYLRYALYRWNAATSNSTVMKAATSIATNEFGNNVANTTYTNTVTFTPDSTLSFLPGDKLVVEIEVDENTTSGGTLSFYWGDATEVSRFVLPRAVSFQKSSAGAFANVLRGVPGVGVTTWGGNWTGVTTYNPATTTAALITATAEWQICFKCHSNANANVTAWGGSGAAAWTNLALEFNPNNESGHPIVASLNNYPNSNTPKALDATQMRAPWTNVGNQVMTCSDCHASDSTVAKGPHGSSTKWMLAGTNKNWPYTSAAYNGTSSGGTLAVMGNTTFCENCHVTSTTGHDANGAWTGQDSAHTGMACVGCHIRVPHGGKTSRLITGTNAPARHKPDGNGGGTIYLDGILKWSTNPADTNCYSTNGSCGKHSSSGSTTRW